jgi:hypothetical protein
MVIMPSSRQTTIVTLLILAGCLSASMTTGCTGHSCGDVGYTCGQTQVALRSKSDAWTAGTYALTADEMGGGSATCTIAVPASIPTNGVLGTCTPPSDRLELAPLLSCPPVSCNGVACGGISCTPIAGHFQMLLSLGTVVSSATVDLVANGTTLVGATVRPAATTTEPNGSGCGECTNASAVLSAD